MTGRGPDYAHNLSTSERETLDRLLTRARPRRRRAAGVPLTAGIAAAAILLLVVSVTTVLRTSRPVDVGASPAPTVLAQLAAAAAAANIPATGIAATTALGSDGPDQAVQASTLWGEPDPHHAEVRLEVIVDSAPTGCLAWSIASLTQPLISPAWPADLLGGVFLTWVAPPSDLAAVAGCEPVSVAPKSPSPLGDTFAYRKSIVAGWQELAARLPEARMLPSYVDSRALDRRVAISSISPTAAGVLDVLAGLSLADSGGDESARWWSLWVELMVSTYTGPELRVAALRAAAWQASQGGDGAAALTDAPDITGRAGVAIRVPYLRFDGATAKLTFDPVTGALLQRAVYYSVGQKQRCEITAFRVADTGLTEAWIQQIRDLGMAGSDRVTD